jgi:hypothetical protein
LDRKTNEKEKMELIKKHLSCLIVLTLISSCGGDKKVKVEKYANGNIKSEIHYLNDSIKDGNVKQYYPNGNLRNDLYYANNKKNGIHKHYYVTGELEAEVPFKDGLHQGETFWYYKNGAVQSKSYWIKGKEYGSASFYYMDGKLERYQCRDFLNNVVYLLKVNEKGEKIKEEGLVFSHFMNTEPGDSSDIVMGELITFEITVPEPPDYKTNIWIRDMADKRITERQNLTIENSTVRIKRVFDRPGKYGIIVIGELRDGDDNLLLRDSVHRSITICN